jgi:midasin (ATPase involved in ribosome maturation)
MDSIMPVCKKSDTPKHLFVYLLAGATMLVSTTVLADFRVVEVQTVLNQDELIVSGTLDLSLSSKVEEAVAKGIPLDVELEFRLKRERKLLWAEQLKQWKLRRQIRYHALSGQYFVNDPTAKGKKLENFISLQQALRHMGTLNELTFNVTSVMQADASYVLDVRVSLDIESLPAPLRPVAYTSLNWRLNSGWTTWTVER